MPMPVEKWAVMNGSLTGVNHAGPGYRRRNASV